MAKSRRRPGERIMLAVKAKAGSMTAPQGEVLTEGIDNGGRRWSIEGADASTMRVRHGNAVVDINLGELLAAATAAVNVDYDDDFGGALGTATMHDANGDVVSQHVGVTAMGNERFTVLVTAAEEDNLAGCVHISVHDHARNAQIPWRILQRIKNEIVGEERWACEWFPPERHLMDEANERHLWVWPEGINPPGPLAYHGERTVCDEAEARDYGARQDPLPEWYPERNAR